MTRDESLLGHEMLQRYVVCRKLQGASVCAIAVGSMFLQSRTRRK